MGRWQQVLADALDQNLAIGVQAAVIDHLGRAPNRAELTAVGRAAHSLAASGRARVLHVPGGHADASAGDRTYLVLAKPNVIINDLRLRGLVVAGSDAASRKNPENQTQTVRNLKRSLRNAASGARLIQADGLDSQPAADLAAQLDEALEELHRLQGSLDQTPAPRWCRLPELRGEGLDVIAVTRPTTSSRPIPRRGIRKRKTESIWTVAPAMGVYGEISY